MDVLPALSIEVSCHFKNYDKSDWVRALTLKRPSVAELQHLYKAINFLIFTKMWIKTTCDVAVE